MLTWLLLASLAFADGPWKPKADGYGRCDDKPPYSAMTDSDTVMKEYFSLTVLPSKCDGSIIENLKREVAKAICLQAYDAVCLREILRGDFAAQAAAGIKNLASAEDKKKIAAYLSDTGRTSNKEAIDRLIGVWDGNGVHDHWAKHVENALENQNVSDGIAAAVETGLSAMKVNPLITGGFSVLQIATRLFTPAPPPEEIKSANACAHYPAFIPAYVPAKTQACAPYFSIRNPQVVEFLRQPACYQDKVMKADKPTCFYYQSLALLITKFNDALLKRHLPALERMPTCGPSGAAGQVKFLATPDGSATIQYVTADFDLAPTKPLAKPKIQVDIHSVANMGDPIRSPFGDYQMQIEYTKPLRNGGLTPVGRDGGHKKLFNIHSNEVRMLKRNQETINKRAGELGLGGNLDIELSALAAITASSVSACCALSNERTRACFESQFRFMRPVSTETSPGTPTTTN